MRSTWSPPRIWFSLLIWIWQDFLMQSFQNFTWKGFLMKRKEPRIFFWKFTLFTNSKFSKFVTLFKGYSQSRYQTVWMFFNVVVKPTSLIKPTIPRIYTRVILKKFCKYFPWDHEMNTFWNSTEFFITL